MPKRRNFIKQLGYGALGLSTVSMLARCSDRKNPGKASPFISLPRDTPESQGVSSAAISQFLRAVNQSGLEFHSFMLVRNARVIAETWWSPFEPSFRHTLYSLSKSFTSTAVGMLKDDGLLSVDDPVLSFFPDDAPGDASEFLKAMKIKHLLTMTTGHSEKPMTKMQQAPDGNWPRVFLTEEINYEPGTHFLYNTGASYMLSAIIQKVTGKSLHTFLTERLFKPLNIAGADWEVDPKGINVGGYGLRVKTEDIAKFGQLYLQNGDWNGAQLISGSWVSEATRKQTESQPGDNDWAQGYGYQFWRCKPVPGFYRGDGAFGQYCIVIPQKNTVIAVTSESKDMQASMNLIWDHILPALSDNEQLTPDDEALNRLSQELKNQQILPLAVNPRSPMVSGISGYEFSLEENDRGVKSITFSFVKDKCSIIMKHSDGIRKLKCGMGNWVLEENQMNIDGSLFIIPKEIEIKSKVAACATWKDNQTLLVNLKFVEGIHSDTWTCKFDGEKLRIDFQNSVSLLQNTEDKREAWIGLSS